MRVACLSGEVQSHDCAQQMWRGGGRKCKQFGAQICLRFGREEVKTDRYDTGIVSVGVKLKQS